MIGDSIKLTQDRFVFKPLYEEKVRPSEHVAPESPVLYTEGLRSEEFFKLFAELSKENPITDETYVEYFELFGYDRKNSSFDYTTLSQEQKEALEKGRTDALQIIRSGIRSDKYTVRKKGWFAITGGIGNYGNDYRQRALTAYGGWGANLIEDSAYVRKTNILVASRELINGEVSLKQYCRQGVYKALKNFPYTLLDGGTLSENNLTDTTSYIDKAKKEGARFVIIAEADAAPAAEGETTETPAEA